MKTPTLLFLILIGGFVYAQPFYQEMEPGDMKSVTVTLSESEFREEGNYGVWEPGRTVRRAAYETNYIGFTYDVIDDLSEAGDDGDSIRVEMDIVLLGSDVLPPEAEGGESPEGGIRIYRYLAVITGIDH